MNTRLLIVYFLGAIGLVISYWLYGKQEKKRLQKARIARDPHVAREIFLKHRIKILSSSPEELGIKPKQILGTVWGVIMERGLSDGQTCWMEVFVNGTTNLIHSNGVRIGLKTNNSSPNKLRANFLSVAESLYDKAVSVTDYPLPQHGDIQFFLLSHDGARTYATTMANLEDDNSELSQLYLAGCAIENKWHKMISPS